MPKPVEFSRKAKQGDMQATAPLDGAKMSDGRLWFAEARAQSAREEQELEAWRARRRNETERSDSGYDGVFSVLGDDCGSGGDGGGD